ncbi:GIY-YIG nuclease family protein [Dictyobacter arantiisoli]|uniref:GIY-YIG nuclease family protein n=1 Tax=Dictyobacter arantiisoli TaxID=2014874 RepID=UPI0011EDDEF1
MSTTHYVYIVRCSDTTFYTGYTTDVTRRLAMHNAGKGARYTRARLPVVLMHSWTFPTKSEALRVEYAVKQWTRAQKLRLLAAPELIQQLSW